MATLVLGAVGTLVGGPLGGALGALVGRQVDGALIGSPTRDGPRLEELKITTSSYGQPIPRHAGRMRTAGTIVWATDLKEQGETSGGKGRPKTTTYSYSTSFAVALASHPIDGIGRIWADGNLLRGATGDLKTGGRLRIHTGHGDQAPDPLLKAALGDECPAFRGIAYLVFEDLQLGEFGNRIPALSYEVSAGAGAQAMAVLAQAGDAAGTVRVDPALAVPHIQGFTHAGEPPMATLALLDRVLPVVPVAVEDGLRLAPVPDPSTAVVLGPPTSMPDGDAGDAQGDFGVRDGQRSESAAGAAPGFAGLRYYDVARDYLPGVQHAIARPERTGRDLVDLPVATSAAGARMIGRTMLDRARDRRTRRFVRLAELDPSLEPGAPVRLPDAPGLWSVEAWEWRDGGVELELRRLAARPAIGTVPASSGVAWSPPDRALGRTLLDAFELPWDGFGAPDGGTLHAAVGSTGGRWPGAALYAEIAGGLVPVGDAHPRSAVMGELAEPLPGSPALMLEDGVPLVLDLAATEMALAPAGIPALALGTNRLLLGEEVLQFRDATQIGQRRWRLDGLLRGRLGTEPAALAGHAPGTSAVLLDDRVTTIEAERAAGADRLAAIGPSFSDEDDGPVYAPIRGRGLAAAPPAPVHPRIAAHPDGSVVLAWTGRTRGAWRWGDRAEPAFVEGSGLYEIGAGPTDAPLALWQTGSPTLALTAEAWTELVAKAPGARLWVRQVGAFARSAPLALLALSRPLTPEDNRP